MKKVLSILFTTMFLISTAVYANGDIWIVADKSITQGIDYTSKIGDYFFRFEGEYNEEKYTNNSYLCYSQNGIDFTKTNFLAASLPIYREGLYFLFDTTMSNVPEHKRISGFNNSPSYILDSNMNLLNQMDYNGYAEYEGFHNGYHYIACHNYDDIVYDNGWIGKRKDTVYRTVDGINLEIISPNEDLSFLRGIVLEDNNVLYTSYDEHNNCINTLVTPNGSFEILYEKDNYISHYNEDTNIPLMLLSYKIGEEIVDSADENKMVQSIEKKYLTMDMVYGVEMPEEIGKYEFELNGNLYFNKDDNSYYCISKSKLENKVKVIYNNKILAFEESPIIENGTTLVPMRFLFEQMGAKVEWDQETQTATAKKDSKTVAFSVGNTNASVNGTAKTMAVPAQLVNDKTMIPLRFLSENLGYKVTWDNETRTASITTAE